MKLIPITPPHDLFALAAVARAIKKTLQDTARDAQADLAKTAASWQHKVDFSITPIAEGVQIATADPIWNMVDRGTKPHAIPAIVPKNKKAITVLGPGRPKTAVRVIGSSGGARGGVVAIVKRTKPIQHPGTAAREFSDVVQEKYQTELPRRMQAAIAAAVKG